jgi:hypothetical protein
MVERVTSRKIDLPEMTRLPVRFRPRADFFFLCELCNSFLFIYLFHVKYVDAAACKALCVFLVADMLNFRSGRGSLNRATTIWMMHHYHATVAGRKTFKGSVDLQWEDWESLCSIAELLLKAGCYR